MDDPSDRLGSLLGGRYRLVETLGAGTFGIVYRAEHIELSRDVAVKLLTDKLARDAVARARFHREAQAASALSHPHIVSILDYSGPDEEVPFLTMELLRGGTLNQALSQGLYGVASVARILVQLASALEEAHRRGWVHRDLKLSNVMRVEPGKEHVKVVDFGLAGWTDELRQTQLTETGQLLGSPGYLAPEQLLGQKPGPEADIFALATIGYRCITGQFAYPGSSSSELIVAALKHDPRPLRQLRPECDAALETLLLAGVDRLPTRRPSASDMRQRLEHWLGRNSASSRSPASPATQQLPHSPPPSAKVNDHRPRSGSSTGPLVAPSAPRALFWALGAGIATVLLIGGAVAAGAWTCSAGSSVLRDARAEDLRICAPECGSDSDCHGQPGTLCIDGACRAPCESDRDCLVAVGGTLPCQESADCFGGVCVETTAGRKCMNSPALEECANVFARLTPIVTVEGAQGDVCLIDAFECTDRGWCVGRGACNPSTCPEPFTCGASGRCECSSHSDCGSGLCDVTTGVCVCDATHPCGTAQFPRGAPMRCIAVGRL